MDREVVLPAPLGPSSPKNEPAGTSRSTPLTASTPSKFFTSPRSASAGPPSITTVDGSAPAHQRRGVRVSRGVRVTGRGRRGRAGGAWWYRRRRVHAAGTLIRILAQPSSGGPIIVTSTAATAAPPPAMSPATAPTAVSPRHHSPSTSSGQKLDAATANASPTTCDTSSSLIREESTIGTNPATIAETRKSRTEPRPRTSVDSTPATLVISPDELDRNAANAPAATSAPSSCPMVPVPSAAAGSRSTTASVAPLIISCGV